MAVTLMAGAGITTTEEAEKLLKPVINWFYDDSLGYGEYEIESTAPGGKPENPLEL
jgi:hypothetical protein